MHRKFGFHDEGRFVEHKLKNGSWQDVYRLAFFDSDWAERGDEIKSSAARKQG
jgi:RimJ/RimL family protein N-acetyltransferase